MNEALYLQIQMIGRSNPVVHAALIMAERDQCTYEEALQMAVVNLVAVVDSQQKSLIEIATRQPYPYSVVGAK